MIAVWLAKSLAFVLLDVFTLLCLVSSPLIPSVTSLYISLIFTSVVFFFFLLFFSFYAYSSASFLWFLSSNSLSICLLLLLFHPHCVSLFFCFVFFSSQGTFSSWTPVGYQIDVSSAYIAPSCLGAWTLACWNWPYIHRMLFLSSRGSQLKSDMWTQTEI